MTDYYEEPNMLSHYLACHYGNSDMLGHGVMPPGLDYHRLCIEQCIDHGLLLYRSSRGLDLGCAVGAASFTLLRYCKEVIGIDSSKQFITTARRLQKEKVLRFSFPEEGDLCREVVYSLPPDLDTSNLSFVLGDILHPPLDIGQFDVVLSLNLLDRINDPAALLQQLKALLLPGGQLVISSPNTWLEYFTPKKRWLGGFLRHNKPVYTLDTLHQLLEPALQFRQVSDVPILIPEHSRKFQLLVTQVSTWVRTLVP